MIYDRDLREILFGHYSVHGNQWYYKGYNTLEEFLSDYKNQKEKIESLELSQTMPRSDLHKLKPILASNQNITKLQKSWGFLGPKFMKELCKVLGQNTIITELYLRHNHFIDDEDLEGRRQAVQFKFDHHDRYDNTRLDITLSNASFYWVERFEENERNSTCCFSRTDRRLEAMKILSSYLENNNTLTSLNLQSNALDHHHIKELCSSLKRNHKLRELNLSCNNIDMLGLKYITNMLKHNKSLTSLEIWGCGYIFEQNSDQWQTLVQVISENNTLSKLDIVDQIIKKQKKLGEELAQALQKNARTAIQTAFMMGFHKRLGKMSSLSSLKSSAIMDNNVLRLVFDFAGCQESSIKMPDSEDVIEIVLPSQLSLQPSSTAMQSAPKPILSQYQKKSTGNVKLIEIYNEDEKESDKIKNENLKNPEDDKTLPGVVC